MELWQLYLLVTLPRIAEVLLAGGIIGLLLAALGGGFWMMLKDIAYSEDERARCDVVARWVKRILVIAVVCLPFGVLTPSQSGLYTIVGGYYATNIEGMEDLPPNIVKAANAFLEKYATESSE